MMESDKKVVRYKDFNTGKVKVDDLYVTMTKSMDSKIKVLISGARTGLALMYERITGLPSEGLRIHTLIDVLIKQHDIFNGRILVGEEAAEELADD